MYADNRNRWHLLHLAEGLYKIYKNVWLFQYLEFYTSLTFRIIILQFWQHKMLNQQLNVSTAQQGVMFECFRSCSCSCACVLPLIFFLNVTWYEWKWEPTSKAEYYWLPTIPNTTLCTEQEGDGVGGGIDPLLHVTGGQMTPRTHRGCISTI